MTPPAKPYLYRMAGHWYVQWYVGRRRRLAKARNFRDACDLAATVRRWQLGRSS